MAFELFPVTQWFGSSAPLSGGKIYTYAAGTTTPLATYTDSTGGTPNANPTILDAAGRGQLWLSPAAYKFVYKDASDVTQQTIDNIQMDNLAATIATLAMTGTLTLQQSNAATSGANQSSNQIVIQAKYWNGSASATDQWTIQDVLGTGTNPTSTLTFAHSGSSGAQAISIPAIALTAGTFQGAWGKGSAGSPYILQLVDNGSLNNQVIGFNVEQETNPSGSAGWISFAQAVELFSPTSNSQTFPVDFVGCYGSCSHFGSGAIANMHGGDFEAFNSGPATAILVVGCAATANNGGVASGSPVQTPTNTGLATNLRAFDGICKNLSSGTVTNAVVFYAEAATKPGGGTITNVYGLQIADQTAGTNNFGIVTGLGKNQFGDTVQFNGLVSQGIAPDSARGMFIFPSSATGLAGTSQLGIQVVTNSSSAATVVGEGIRARCDTANAAFVQALNINFHAETPTKGAASTITEWNGLRIESGPTAGTAFAIKTVGTDPILFNGTVTQQTPNDAQWIQGQASELLTLSTSGTTTDTSANLLPANSIIEAVVARVTTTITTATDWKLGDGTISGRFAAANAVMTAGSTSVGTVQADQTGTSGPRQAAAAKVRVTTTGTPGAGVIRITVFYRQFVAPTS